VLLWPIPRGSEPDPNLKVPFPGAQVESSADPYTPVLGNPAALHPEAVEDDVAVAEELITFGSSEYASVVLGGLWASHHRSIWMLRPICIHCLRCWLSAS